MSWLINDKPTVAIAYRRECEALSTAVRFYCYDIGIGPGDEQVVYVSGDEGKTWQQIRIAPYVQYGFWFVIE